MGTGSKIIAGGISAVAAGAIIGDFQGTITATGSTQATAFPITTDIAAVSTTAASTGVVLPLGETGKSGSVFNGGANTLTVYPPVGGNINGGTTNAGISVTTLKGLDYTYLSALNIYANNGA